MSPCGSAVSQPARGSAEVIGVVVILSELSKRPMAVLRLTYSPFGPDVTPNGCASAAIGNDVIVSWPSLVDPAAGDGDAAVTLAGIASATRSERGSQPVGPGTCRQPPCPGRRTIPGERMGSSAPAARADDGRRSAGNLREALEAATKNPRSDPPCSRRCLPAKRAWPARPCLAIDLVARPTGRPRAANKHGGVQRAAAAARRAGQAQGTGPTSLSRVDAS